MLHHSQNKQTSSELIFTCNVTPSAFVRFTLHTLDLLKLENPRITLRFSSILSPIHLIIIFWGPSPGLTRCSWQDTKVWNPGATPNPSWSMNGGSSWVWIWTLIPASNDVSSVGDSERLAGHFTTAMVNWYACLVRCRQPTSRYADPMEKRSFSALEYVCDRWRRNTPKSEAEINTTKLQKQHIINSSYNLEGAVLKWLSLYPFRDGHFGDDSIHMYPWGFVLTLAEIRRELIQKEQLGSTETPRMKVKG